MEKETLNKFLAIKKAIEMESPASMKDYNKILAEIEQGPDLIEGILAAGFSVSEMLIVIDLILWEKRKSEDLIYNQVAIFTTNKNVQ